MTWLPVLPGFLLLGFSFWVLTRRPNEIIHDSKTFTDALELWQPVIGEQFKTPREIKRFLNRVRYIAMRWRQPSAQKTPLERLADWFQARLARLRPGRAPEPGIDASAGAGEDELFEAGLVAMAALEGLGGERLGSATTRHWLPTTEKAGAIRHQHYDKFGNLDWKRYREITGEVEAN